MRIAYIINSLEGGGAAFPIPAILSLMRQKGAKICVFALTLRDGKALPSIEKAGFPVIVRKGNRKDHLNALLWLHHQISIYKPTHLWTSLTRATLMGQLVGLKKNLPVVSWQHAAYLNPWNQRLLKIAHNLSQLWLCDSEKVAELTKLRLHIPEDRLITWPLFQCNPSAPQSKPWEPGHPVRIASLGRLHTVKGYDILIEAVRLLQTSTDLPPYTLTIYGEGEERSHLNTLIQDYHLEDRIFLPGFVEKKEIILANQHLYIQPSRSEGLCIAAHEAMQAGLPVIASAVGALPSSIQSNVTGLTVSPEDPDQLAKALQTILCNPKKLARMGQAARQKMLRDFSTENFIELGTQIFHIMERMPNKPFRA